MKSRKIFQKKTKNFQKIRLDLDNETYTVSDLGDNEQEMGFSGNFSDKEFNLYVDSDIPNSDENKDLGIEISIINGSGRNVNVVLKDKTGKVRILDRNRNHIYVKSDSEKVYLR